MSQDGRDTSGKAPSEQSGTAAAGDGKAGTPAAGKSTETPKRVQPTPAGAAEATTAPADAEKPADARAAAKSTAKASAARRDAASPAAAAGTDAGTAATDRNAGKPTGAAAATSASRAGRRSPEPAAGGLAPVLWTLLVVAVGAGVAIATLPRWQPAWNENVAAQFPALRIELGGEGGGPLDRRLADVESRLGDIAALDRRSQRLADELNQAIRRIAELETGIREVRAVAERVAEGSAQADADDALQSINRRLGALEDRAATDGELERSVSEVQGRLSSLEQQSEDARAELQDRLDRLAQSATATRDDSQALVLAVAQLRDSVRRGVPYAEDLEALRTVAGDADELAQPLAQLEGHAATGIPTLATLTQRFQAIAGGLVIATRASDDASWWRRAVDEVGGLVSVRRKDGAAGGVEGAVAQAEAMLADGDLKGAFDVLGGVNAELAPNARQVLGPWLADARARLAAERALATLHLRAISRLGDAG